MDSSTRTLGLDDLAGPLTWTDAGTGRPFLLLHGGGGVATVADLGARLAAHGRVVTPRHPGFDGTPRPDGMRSPRDLARLYAALLAELDLRGVTVVGNSLGGWVAAEIAALADPRVRDVVLVDAVGLDLPDAPAADFFSLTPDEVIDRAYARPEAVRAHPPSPEQVAEAAANRAAAPQARYGA
jgi:pimeloyl-ACP methyl ester carboxylesterase